MDLATLWGIFSQTHLVTLAARHTWSSASFVRTNQGDQIGRVFAQWEIVYFGQWFKNYRSSAHFWATFFHGTSHVSILTKKMLGYILGDFFTNSSGHPGTNIVLLVYFISFESAQKLCKLSHSVAVHVESPKNLTHRRDSNTRSAVTVSGAMTTSPGQHMYVLIERPSHQNASSVFRTQAVQNSDKTIY
jgi:hypothetical protein